MNLIKWWSVAEGKDIHTETGDGYFRLTETQARPNWFGFAFGLFLAGISFTIAAYISRFTPPEPVGFWFFVLFGIFAIVFCFGVGLLTWLRQTSTTCLVSEGKIVWNDESGLPKRFDHRGEITIASIQSISTEYWHDGSIRGLEFELGNETKMIKGSLGPALCARRWRDDFLNAIFYWNSDIREYTKRSESGRHGV